MNGALASHTWHWPAADSRRVLITRSRIRSGDVYLRVLFVAILGYAVAGRGFAYLGVPPVYVGEVVLVAGLAVALWEGSVARALGAPALKALVALMLWVVLRTVP